MLCKKVKPGKVIVSGFVMKKTGYCLVIWG